MKKILVKSGSPKKNGNTMRIVRKIDESIKILIMMLNSDIYISKIKT